jgi:cation diffusion facilitator CzcD-associated flavoprotein CzcO
MARITSPFGFTSTSGDVTRGVDLGGRRIVVTGGGSGLGRATALALAKAVAQVTIAVRTPAEPPDPAIRWPGSTSRTWRRYGSSRRPGQERCTCW